MQEPIGCGAGLSGQPEPRRGGGLNKWEIAMGHDGVDGRVQKFANQTDAVVDNRWRPPWTTMTSPPYVVVAPFYRE